MNSNELITEVDKDDNVIGLRPRRDFDQGHFIHRSSYLLVINSARELLLQQRHLAKAWHPGSWTFPVAGTVGKETYEECMQRETREAFGKELDFISLLKYRHFDDVDKAFKTVFLAKAEKNELSFNKSYSETHDWISFAELQTQVYKSQEKYAPPFITGMKIIYEKNLL